MFEQDYIMRQVQEMIEALNVVLRLKKDGKYKEALHKIHQNYRQFFDHSRKEIRQMEEGQLLGLCSSKNQFSSEMAIVLADMLHTEGTVLEEQHLYNQAVDCYANALFLYQKCLHTKGAVLPIDILETVHKLKEKIASE